jgi:nitronate monooxygenase
MRTFYALRSLRRLKRDSMAAGGRGDTEYWQAGKSVDGIDSVESAASIVHRFADALD